MLPFLQYLSKVWLFICEKISTYMYKGMCRLHSFLPYITWLPEGGDSIYHVSLLHHCSLFLPHTQTCPGQAWKQRWLWFVCDASSLNTQMCMMNLMIGIISECVGFKSNLYSYILPTQGEVVKNICNINTLVFLLIKSLHALGRWRLALGQVW